MKNTLLALLGFILVSTPLVAKAQKKLHMKTNNLFFLRAVLAPSALAVLGSDLYAKGLCFTMPIETVASREDREGSLTF